MAFDESEPDWYKELFEGVERKSSHDRGSADGGFTMLYDLTGVSSSWIESVGYAYNNGSKGIVVKFLSGSTIMYEDTSLHAYEDFIHAESPGRYLHTHLYELPYVTL